MGAWRDTERGFIETGGVLKQEAEASGGAAIRGNPGPPVALEQREGSRRLVRVLCRQFAGERFRPVRGVCLHQRNPGPQVLHKNGIAPKDDRMTDFLETAA